MQLALIATVAATGVVAGSPGTAVADVEPTRAAAGARIVSIEVGGVPTSVVGMAGAVWVAAGPGGIARIATDTNETVARIKPGGSIGELAKGFGALWAIDVFRGRLLRIDPRTSRLSKTIRVGPLPSGLAIGHGLVWVASQLDSTVSGIDPRTGRVEKLARFARGELWPGGLAVGREGVWVITAGGNEVSVFDPATMTFRYRLRVVGARALAMGRRGAWVGLAGQSSVLRIRDAHIEKLETLVPTSGYGPILAAHGRLWVGSDERFSALDRRGTIVRSLRLPNRHSLDAAAFVGDLWVADQHSRKVLRISIEEGSSGDAA